MSIRVATDADFIAIFQVFCRNMTIDGIVRDGERSFVERNIKGAIEQGHCAVALSPTEDVVGFICGFPRDCTRSEISMFGNQVLPSFEDFRQKRGFQEFALALDISFRGQGLGKELVLWLENVARLQSCNYIWFGSEERFQNSEILERHYTKLTKGPNIHFFAKNVWPA